MKRRSHSVRSHALHAALGLLAGFAGGACGGSPEDVAGPGEDVSASSSSGATPPSPAPGSAEGTSAGAPLGPDSTTGDATAADVTATGTTAATGDPAGSGDSGTSGGSDGGDTPPPVDACVNPEDSAILERVDEIMIANECALQNIGDGDGAADCVEARTGLSPECSSCFGLTISCVFEQCIPECFDPSTDACVECRAEHCDPAFAECAGVTR